MDKKKTQYRRRELDRLQTDISNAQGKRSDMEVEL